MTTRYASRPTTRHALRLASAALVAMAAAGVSNCADQREPECTVPPLANFGVRLVEQGTPQGLCTETDPKKGGTLKGGVFGLRPHFVLGDDNYPDYDIPFNVSIQFQDMGELRDAFEEHYDRLGQAPPEQAENLYNFGPFATAKPEGDFCRIPTVSQARFVVPALPAVPADLGDPEDPEDDLDPIEAKDAVDVSAVWSDIRVLSTAGYQGVQFEGTFTYTYNGCTRTYRGVGVWGGNNVTCEGLDEEEHPNGLPDNDFCSPTPSPKNPYGSGINPDFPVSCDAETLLCLLDGNFPAIK